MLDPGFLRPLFFFFAALIVLRLWLRSQQSGKKSQLESENTDFVGLHNPRLLELKKSLEAKAKNSQIPRLLEQVGQWNEADQGKMRTLLKDLQWGEGSEIKYWKQKLGLGQISDHDISSTLLDLVNSGDLLNLQTGRAWSKAIEAKLLGSFSPAPSEQVSPPEIPEHLRQAYDILGAKSSDGEKTLKRRYFDQAKKLHPDQVGDEAGKKQAHKQFQKLGQSFDQIKQHLRKKSK